MYNADIPIMPPTITTKSAPPKGNTATKGPSHVSGSCRAIWLGARTTLAVALQALEYATQKI